MEEHGVVKGCGGVMRGGFDMDETCEILWPAVNAGSAAKDGRGGDPHRESRAERMSWRSVEYWEETALS